MIPCKHGIQWKMLLACLAAVVVVIGLTAVLAASMLQRYIGPEIEAMQRAEVERAENDMKSHVAMVCALLDEARVNHERGRLTLDEAKSQALKRIETLRYDAGRGYFWINETAGKSARMLMHPVMPEYNGRIMDDPEFTRTVDGGGNYFAAVVDICANKGEGFVDYLRPASTEAGTGSPGRMISYVRLYEPFGWIIGTEKNIDGLAVRTAYWQKDLTGKTYSTMFRIFGLAGVLLALSLYPLLLLAEKIIDPAGKSLDLVRAVGQGDLTFSPTGDRNREAGSLAGEFSTMIGSLRSLLQEVRQQAEIFHNAAGHLSGYSKNMSDATARVSEQSAAVAAAANQFSGNIAAIGEEVSSISRRANNIAANIGEMSDNMNSVSAAVEEMSHSIAEVAKHCADGRHASEKALKLTDESCDKVSELTMAADNIDQVINMITEITEQTKLLALNATIEAARAGGAGRGFAVVAGEVKELARQAALATEDISARIKAMHQQTMNVVKMIQDVAIHNQQLNEVNTSIAAAVEQQSSTAGDISRILGANARGSDAISREVQQLNRSIREEIARSISEASSAVNELSGNIHRVNEGVKEGASAAAGNFVFAREMSRVAAELKAGLGRFHLGRPNFDIGKVKAAHLAWRTHLEAMLHRGMELSLASLPDHTQCDFGKWIAGPEGQALADHESFPEMYRLHEQVHLLAYDIAVLHHEGRRREALELMDRFEQTREDLFAALDRLHNMT